MNCPRCDTTAREGSAYCAQCGAALARTCGQCHAPLDPDARFCSQCGTAAEAETSRPGLGGETAAHRAERRQLTIVFIDLVDSTALSERFDPEEWRSVVQEYQQACAHAVERFGGLVAQYLGDGMLCYFGYPRASEHDAENAVRAALAAVENVADLRIELEDGSLSLHARAAVHTGPVVVGEIGAGARRETLAVGRTTNLAARIEGLARPDCVVMSSATEQLVRGRFVLEDLGAQRVRGIADRVTVFRVLAADVDRDRLDLGSRDLTPLTGRQPELDLLLDRWRRAAQGDRQIVLISGEAGIGKSRLVRAVRERIGDAEHAWLVCRAAPHGQEISLYPVVDLVERTLGFRDARNGEEKIASVEQALASVGVEDPEALSLMASLLGLPKEGLAEVVSIAPAQWRTRSLELLADLVLGFAGGRPLALVLEDLHWMDASTLEWIRLVAGRRRSESLLLLATQRPQPLPAWANDNDVLGLSLNPLTRDEADAIVQHMASQAGVDLERLRDVASLTDGNPLYIEELAQALIALPDVPRATAPGLASESSVPETLQDPLMARLDATGAAKEAAQIAACLGREFPIDLLAAIWHETPDVLRDQLGHLQRAGLVYQRSESPKTYLFKHALIRDCAYQSLLRKRRQKIHRQIAQVLSSDFGELADNQPELLAHHFMAASLPAEAIEQLCRAGKREGERFAHEEAVRHYKRALEVLGSLDESAERHARELAIRMSLGSLLSSTEGYGADQVRANTARVRQLCDEVGDSPQVFMALFQQWSLAMGREDTDQLESISEELLERAQKAGDRGLQVETELAMGMVRHIQGDAEGCIAHMRNSSALYDRELDRSHAAIFGLDPGVIALSVGGTNLVSAGYLDQAVAWHRQAQELAEEVDHPYTRATSLAWFASALNQRRDYERALDLAQRSLQLGTEGGFKLMATGALGHVAGALVGLGRLDEAVEYATQSSRGYVECNSRLASTSPVLHLARARLQQGDVEAGLLATQKCRALLSDGVDLYQWPETLRIEAELLLLRSEDQIEPAEKRLRKALEIADGQNARYPGLTSASSLAALLARTGRRAEARDALEARLGWFQEGLETPVLVSARALLAQL